MSGTSLLARNCPGSAKKPSSNPKITTALTSPAVAGTMKAFSAFSNLTSTPWNRGRRDWAISCEIATRIFRARSAGAFFGPSPASNCCVRLRPVYSCSQRTHVSMWRPSARIWAPLTCPSRYGENIFLASAQFMASPQPLCHHANHGYPWAGSVPARPAPFPRRLPGHILTISSATPAVRG